MIHKISTDVHVDLAVLGCHIQVLHFQEESRRFNYRKLGLNVCPYWLNKSLFLSCFLFPSTAVRCIRMPNIPADSIASANWAMYNERINLTCKAGYSYSPSNPFDTTRYIVCMQNGTFDTSNIHRVSRHSCQRKFWEKSLAVMLVKTGIHF